MPRPIEDLAISLRRCADFDALRGDFIDFFSSEGVQMMSYHHLPPPGASDYRPSITVTAHGFPDGWLNLYLRRKFYEIDPIPKHALNSVYPFWWSQIRAVAGLSKSEVDYLDALEQADFGDGLAIPLFGPHGRNGYAGLGGGKGAARWDEEKIARLQIAAQLGHMKYCDILHAHAPSDVRLSARESEILEWVARGKSNSVIAEILQLSRNTIDTYLRRIFEKLGVGDRVTAALRGLALGVIG
ncbi:MAG: LuxR family transcriptional regulator [Pseudomonadota bacterium]